MYITAYGNGARDGLDVGFFHEDCADTVAENLHVRLGEVLAAHELCDPLVGVVASHSVKVRGVQLR